MLARESVGAYQEGRSHGRQADAAAPMTDGSAAAPAASGGHPSLHAGVVLHAYQGVHPGELSDGQGCEIKSKKASRAVCNSQGSRLCRCLQYQPTSCMSWPTLPPTTYTLPCSSAAPHEERAADMGGSGTQRPSRGSIASAEGSLQGRGQS